MLANNQTCKQKLHIVNKKVIESSVDFLFIRASSFKNCKVLKSSLVEKKLR